MSCNRIQASFDERLDGRLAEAVRDEFDAHVTACPMCRPQWQAYRAAWEVVARHEAIEPSFGFVERTLRRLDEAVTAPRHNFVLRWATAASLAVVLGFSSWHAWQRVQTKHRLEAYALAQQQDYLEDFDVIASLDKLNGGNKL